jgi:hypothetical protein
MLFKFFTMRVGLIGAMVVLSADLPALIGAGVSSTGVLETVPPTTGSLTIPSTATTAPIGVDYSGVADAHSALGEVAFWYRTDLVDWTPSGLSDSASAGTFSFMPPGSSPGNHGTYYFQIVAVDELGNSSAIPAGSVGLGQGGVAYDTSTSVGSWWVLE